MKRLLFIFAVCILCGKLSAQDITIRRASDINTNLFVSSSSGTATNLTVVGNVSLLLTEANPTNVVNFSYASQTNVLDDALTILHATNGVSGKEISHVRWLWAGGSDRTLTIPSAWKTNVNSPVPVSITNGTITKIYITAIGDTGSSANQSNVFVSFEYFK